MSKIKPRYPNSEELEAYTRKHYGIPEGAPLPELSQWQRVELSRQWAEKYGTAIAQEEERRRAESEYRCYHNLAASRERGESGGDAA